MEVGKDMKKISLVLLGLMVLSLIPGLSLADCLDLSSFTGWALQDSNRIIFYRDRRPLALIHIPDCSIRPDSSVRLLQSYVCDGDKIEIDGEACSIMTVKLPY